MRSQNRNDYRINVNPNSFLEQYIYPNNNTDLSRDDIYPDEKYEEQDEVIRGL